MQFAEKVSKVKKKTFVKLVPALIIEKIVNF